MASDWENILRQLNSYPPQTNILLPPCSEEQLRKVQSELGRLPDGVIDMLRHFNGGNLFDNTGPLLSIFRASTIPSLPAFEWAPEYTIDKFTPRWRAAGEDRQGDWAIAMMNYGGLVIVGADGRVREWDAAQRMWDPRTFDNLAEWFQDILREGADFMKEE